MSLREAYNAYVTGLRRGKKPMTYEQWLNRRAIAVQEFLRRAA